MSKYTSKPVNLLEMMNVEQSSSSDCMSQMPRVHGDDGIAYILALDIPAWERPYVAAMNYGGQCPIPVGMKKGEHAYYLQDYMRWHDWRVEQGDNWRDKTKYEWWYDFISMQDM